MAEDVYEPLSRYRDEFREKFSRLARDKFKELTRASGLDVAAHRKLVAYIKKLQAEADSASAWKGFWLFLMIVGFVAAVVGIIWFNVDPDYEHHKYAMAVVFAGVALGMVMIPPYRSQSSRHRELSQKVERRKQEAWQQMEPLNRLYTWDLTAKLIEATVPRLEFDPYFTAQRLTDLERIYNWDHSFNADKSMLFAQSGVINGNPFVFGDYMDMEWGTETYTGSRTISWTEYEEDEEGRPHPVTRYETLYASVTKPKPEYQTRKFLLYGNDAAPNLEFSRQPSDLSGDDDGFFARMRMKRQVKRLQEFSRKLDDEYNYTMMGNHEFEALFETKDRTNEVEYRLLFTPVAQMQMLALLKDKTVGYGDDFAFYKQRKLNYIFARHLENFKLDTDPKQFHDWDWDQAGLRFLVFNERYFKSVYFALAPLLAIPLYQQTRNHEEIWKGVIEPVKRASFWEHESLANYYGEEKFQHSQCITHSLLKTRVLSRSEGVSQVAVTAHGYRGEKRVDYQQVHGGDGNWHSVPVEWIEYLPVQNTSTISVAESGDSTPTRATNFRRSIYSWL